MGIPLLSKDFDTKAFTRLARFLIKEWPGDTPLRLSESQNMLSQILGYKDFHDARMSVHAQLSSASSTKEIEEIKREAYQLIVNKSGVDHFYGFSTEFPIGLLNYFSSNFSHLLCLSEDLIDAITWQYNRRFLSGGTIEADKSHTIFKFISDNVSCDLLTEQDLRLPLIEVLQKYTGKNQKEIILDFLKYHEVNLQGSVADAISTENNRVYWDIKLGRREGDYNPLEVPAGHEYERLSDFMLSNAGKILLKTNLDCVYLKPVGRCGLRKWGVEYQQNNNDFLQLNESYQGIEFDFRMHRFNEQGSKNIRSYGWSCRVVDSGGADGVEQIKAIVSGTVYSKIKSKSIQERDLIYSADVDSDLTVGLMEDALTGLNNFMLTEIKHAKEFGEESGITEFNTYLNKRLDAELLTLIELYDMRDDVGVGLIQKIIEFSCISLKAKLKRACLLLINGDSTNYRYSKSCGLPKILNKRKSEACLNLVFDLGSGTQFRKSISDIGIIGLNG